MSDNPQSSGMPAWGWLLIVIALAMLAGLIYKTLSTGGGR